MLGRRDPGGAAKRLYAAIAKPFPLYLAERQRKRLAFALASLALDRRCLDVLRPDEPDPPWKRAYLRFRRDCYRRFAPARAGAARADLQRFDAASSPPLGRWLGLE